MAEFIKTLKRALQGDAQSPASQLTRAQARKLILTRIDPLLKREGFIHRKGNNIWRIRENKTDIIELRFLTLEERRQFKIPESTFSLLYGCYYHFIPDIHNGRYIHQLQDFITPLEVHCHYRMRATRTIKQKPKKIDMSAWHLDEPEKRQQLVLNDVVDQLESEIFPTLNRLIDIQEWINVLESTKFNLGIGGANSKSFLLGFTYKHLGDKEKAKTYLMNAKELAENYNKKFAKYSKEFPPDAPLFMQLKILNSAVAELEN